MACEVHACNPDVHWVYQVCGLPSGLEDRLSFQDKILQSVSRDQKVTVTNDGATILKSLYVDNPAAKVLVGKRVCQPCMLGTNAALTLHQQMADVPAHQMCFLVMSG